MLNIVKNYLERRSKLIKASRENGKTKKRTTEVMGSVTSVLGISTLAANTSNAVEESNESSTNMPVNRLDNGENVNTTQVEETSIKRQSKLIISKVENNKIIVARKINTTQKSVKFIKSYSNNDTTNTGGKTTSEEFAVSSTVPHDPAVEESTALKKISNNVAADSDTVGLKNKVTKYKNSEKIIDLGDSSDSESTIVLSCDLNKNKKMSKSKKCSSKNPKRVLMNFSKNLNGRSTLSVHKKLNKSATVISSSKLVDKKNNKSQDIYVDDSDLTLMLTADEPNKSQNIIKNEINDVYVGDSDSTLVLTPGEQNKSQSIDINKVNTCLGDSDSPLTLTPDEPSKFQNIIKNKVNDTYEGDSDSTLILTPDEHNNSQNIIKNKVDDIYDDSDSTVLLTPADECENRKKITNKTFNKTKESTEPPKKKSKNSGVWKNGTSQSTKIEAPCALSSQESKDKISKTFRDGSVNLSGLPPHELEEKLSEIIGDGQLEPQSHLLTQDVLKSSQNNDSADKSDKNHSLEDTLKLNETLDIRKLDDTLRLSQTNESTDSSLLHLNYQLYNENSDDELTDSSLGKLVIDESADKTIDSMDPMDISNIDQNNDSLDDKEDSPDVSMKSFGSNIKLKRLEKKRELAIRIERLDVAGLIKKPSNLCMQKELRVRLERLPFVNKKITPIKAQGKKRKSPDQKLLKKNKNGGSDLETSLKIVKIVLTPINLKDYPNLRNFQTDSPINCSNFQSSTVDKKLTKNNSTTRGNKSKILGSKKQSDSTLSPTRKRLVYKNTPEKSNSIKKRRRPNLKAAIKNVNSAANNNLNENSQLKKELRVNLVRLSMNDVVLWQSNVQRQNQIYKILFKGIKSKIYEKMIRKLGGVITDNPTIATVLIAEKISKTYEFISALVRGIPIVSIEWLHMSIEKNRFIEPTEYLLEDVKAEKMLNFNFKKSLMRSKETSLLKDYFFIIISSVSLLSTDKLTSLIELAGGKNLSQVPELLINEKIFIVCCKKDIRQFEKLYVDRRVEIVTAEFIIDSLLKQEFRFERPSL
ncbi:uncharacterized protein LOC130665461 isoform X2 [Microplitis mediator]|uniref:uncharacterized protein LOC130665461 isoform X2 n=1 Tax=Microplitis mediator TaxID=375433 RepID=UPI00255612DD|nr:uncharacterized protein LOC130665461 isoform X2 [Microplitis mediator]